MEDMGVNWEQKTLISELIQGMEMTKQLRVHLKLASSFETRDLLVQKILSSYEKALLILRWGGSIGKPQTTAATAGVPSINGNPRSEDFNKDNQDYGDVSKKRKTSPRWTSQVRVVAENALEGHDDGYNWRKYGQKDILGAKHPRSYYRCTYRNTQNCWATKQVQRSDDNPTIFEIKYKVKHTCFQGSQSVPPPASPEKQEQKNPDHCKHISHQEQQQQRSQQLLNFHKELRVNTEEFDNTQMQLPFSFPSTFEGINSISPALDNTNLIGSFSLSYISPATPEPDYFSLPACTMINFNGNHNAHRSEYDSTEIISCNSSSSNSPALDSVFPLNPLEIDPNFPFDTSGFFS